MNMIIIHTKRKEEGNDEDKQLCKTDDSVLVMFMGLLAPKIIAITNYFKIGKLRCHNFTIMILLNLDMMSTSIFGMKQGET